MDEVKCPACGEPYLYWGRERLIKCECLKCKHVFYSRDKKTVFKPYGVILSYYVKFDIWIKTNWTKVCTFAGDKVISERTVYTSRCWFCHSPIKAVVSGSNLNKFFGNYLYGNKKCNKPDCNYFICNKCGKCLCDGPFSYRKKEKPISRIWKE